MVIAVQNTHIEELKAHNIVLKHKSGKPIEIVSLTTALYCLLISQKYEAYELTKYCIRFIYQQLSVNNVLDIITTVSSFTSLCSCKKSCIPVRTFEDQNANNELTELYEKLAFKCLQTIDRHAETLLSSDDFLLLSAKMVQFILKRDTLCLSSESVAVTALNRWCVAQCKREGIPPTVKNKNKILYELKLCIRWLTFRPEELEICQAQHGLLKPKEFNLLLGVVHHENCTCPLTSRFETQRKKMGTRRCGHLHFRDAACASKVKSIESMKPGKYSSCRDVSDNAGSEIYESIDDIKKQNWDKFNECFNLGDHEDYSFLELNKSNDYILADEQRDECNSMNSFVFCFTCLFD